MNLIEQTLTSLQVAEMIEKTHANLLKDIRRYSSQLGEVKIDFSDFWKEDTYKSEQGKAIACYLVTKKGCEFIAHKLTGVKGTAFTARYINAFHDMEQKIKEQQKPKQIENLAPWEREDWTLGTSAPKWPTPPDRIWYTANKPRINEICKTMEISHKMFFHRLLMELANWFNIKDRKELYRATYGIYPAYNMDLLDEFEDMEDVAENYLDFLEISLHNYKKR